MRLGVDLFCLQERSSGERGIGRFTRGLLRSLLAAPGAPIPLAPDSQVIGYVVSNKRIFDLPRSPQMQLRPLLRTLPTQHNHSDSLDRLIAAEGNPDDLDALITASPLQGVVRAHAHAPPRLAIWYDTIPERFPETHLRNEGAWRVYRETLATLRTYEAVLTLSEHARGDLIESHHFPAERVTRIGCGVDPAFRPALDYTERHADAAIVSDLFGEDLRGDFVLNVGGLDERKGSRRLIEAFALLPPEMRDRYRLVFAFDADPIRRGELVKAGRAAGLADGTVLTTAWIGDRQLVALYRQAALMAFPSTYEGFGLPIAEAMACGCPCLAGNNSSQPEAAQGGAWLVDADDVGDIAEGLETLLDDAELLADMAKAGPGLAAYHNWGDVARRTLAAIESVTGVAA